MARIINTRDSYFNYLMSLISNDDIKAQESYQNLCLLFFSMPFTVLNPMDANRVSDAEELRERWLDDIRIKNDKLKNEYARDIITWPISFLEVVIALAYKVYTQILADPSKPDLAVVIFWDWIDNLVKYGTFGTKYTCVADTLTDDVWCQYINDAISASVKKVLTRTYHEDGKGGLFPLRNAKINQRKTEMWNGCIAYINENYADTDL